MPSDDTHVLLVHGAFHGGWCWDRLLPYLAERGIDASVVDLPFTSQADDWRTVEEAIDRLAHGGRRVMVVGHSHGGSVISGSGYRADYLVYLTALMTAPDDEIDLGGAPGMSAIIVDGNTASIDLSQAAAAFYHRCDPADAEWATARLRPMPVTTLRADGEPEPAWRSVASTYIVCDDDQIIAPAAQEQMAGHATAVRHIDSDHSPFLACPAELASHLAEIIGA
jgi:pimeloyl-ACP methyl ester carboxylesterase